MHATTYATTSDFRNYLGGGPVPAELDRSKLITASRRIDRALIGARYATDDDGLPSDGYIAGALRDATCAQVKDMLANGAFDGASAAVSDIQIGSVRIGRNAAAAGAQPSGIDVATDALDILAVAGLYPVEPWVNG